MCVYIYIKRKYFYKNHYNFFTANFSEKDLNFTGEQYPGLDRGLFQKEEYYSEKNK